MQINKSTGPVASNSGAPGVVQGASARADVASHAQTVGAVDRADKVQFSAEALRLADALSEGSEAGAELSEARREEIVTRLASGAYNTEEVADNVARAILGRSDL